MASRSFSDGSPSNNARMSVPSYRDFKAVPVGELIHESYTASINAASPHSLSVNINPYSAASINVGLSQDDSFNTSFCSTIPEDKRVCCGAMTPVRRTFCLLCLFDFLLATLLWIIYTQIVGKTIKMAMMEEIVHYSIYYSLFDTVIVAACRFVILLVIYAGFRVKKSWWLALTTGGTCAFLVAKVFLFDFGENNKLMSYALIVISFIISWIETWFMDFKVLPQEKKMRDRAALTRYIQHHNPTLGHPPFHFNHPNDPLHNDEYYSPVDSFSGSDDELLDPCGDNAEFSSLHTSHSRKSSDSMNVTLADQEKVYREKAYEIWDTAWIMSLNKTGWKLESGSDERNGCVHSKTYPEAGKCYRLQGQIDASAKQTYHELVNKSSGQSSWNPTVKESKIVHIIDDNIDILYTVATESAGGVISSRDFVNLRHYGTRNDCFVCCSHNVAHPAMPPIKSYIRGENGPGIVVLKPIPGQRNKCHYTFIMSVDLKGWIPQSLVDRTMSTILLDYLKHIRSHMLEMHSFPPL